MGRCGMLELLFNHLNKTGNSCKGDVAAGGLQAQRLHSMGGFAADSGGFHC